jgi:hypothetical protein
MNAINSDHLTENEHVPFAVIPTIYRDRSASNAKRNTARAARLENDKEKDKSKWERQAVAKRTARSGNTN